MWVLKIVLFLETMLMKTTATNLLTLSTSPSQATTPTLLHTHHTMPMPTTRSQWVEFMADKGVKIPSSWSLLQIKAHWGELQSEHYQPATLEMDAQIAALKRASRKKGDLQDFLTKEGVGFLPNHTIAQLYNLGEKHIYQMFEPVAGEKMNFGEHADLTFQDVLDKFPGYASWAITTMREETQCGWRLKRFATWAMQALHGASHAKPHVGQTAGSNHVSKKPASEASFSLISSTPSKTQEEENTELREKILQLEKEKADLELMNMRSKTRKET